MKFTKSFVSLLLCLVSVVLFSPPRARAQSVTPATVTTATASPLPPVGGWYFMVSDANGNPYNAVVGGHSINGVTNTASDFRQLTYVGSTNNYVVQPGDNVLVVTNYGGAQTITLPQWFAYTQARVLTVIKASNSTNGVVVAPPAGSTNSINLSLANFVWTNFPQAYQLYLGPGTNAWTK